MSSDPLQQETRPKINTELLCLSIHIHSGGQHNKHQAAMAQHFCNRNVNSQSCQMQETTWLKKTGHWHWFCAHSSANTGLVQKGSNCFAGPQHNPTCIASLPHLEPEGAATAWPSSPSNPAYPWSRPILQAIRHTRIQTQKKLKCGVEVPTMRSALAFLHIKSWGMFDPP